MSVLIKGMKMPSSCNGCLFGHWSNRYQVVHCELLNFKEYPADYTGYKAKRLDKCPLVEFPEHHGDLVDVKEIRWDDHYDSDGNLSKYKIAYSDEMPNPVIKGDTLNNECID